MASKPVSEPEELGGRPWLKPCEKFMELLRGEKPSSVLPAGPSRGPGAGPPFLKDLGGPTAASSGSGALLGGLRAAELGLPVLLDAT